MKSSIVKYDVAVVGAGPAGSSAAWHLADAGLKVIVLEKASWPRVKTCGGGMVARALKEIPAEVTLPVLHQCHKTTINLNDVSLSFTATRSTPIVSMIMRSELDNVLLDAAIAKGVDFRDNFPVTRLQTVGNVASLGSSSDQIHANMVIAADGVNSKLADLHGFSDGRILVPAIEWEIPLDKSSMSRFHDVARFDFGIINDGYAWIFPKRDHLSVGLGSMRARSRNLPAVLAAYLKSHGIPADQSLSRKGHLVPLSTRKGMFSRGRVLLVGDAAGFVDPVTAEGLTFAMKSGRSAAEAILAGQSDPAVVPYIYQNNLQQFLLPEMRYGRCLATLLYRLPLWRNYIFKRHGKRFAERMTDLVTGDLSYQEVMRRSRFWARLLGLGTK